MSLRKVKLSRSLTYRVTGLRGPSPVMGKRVRVILNEEKKEFTLDKGWLPELLLHVISGKLAGSTVVVAGCKLKPVVPRTCRCKAYTFPHSPGLGSCESPRIEPDPPELINIESLFTTGVNK